MIVNLKNETRISVFDKWVGGARTWRRRSSGSHTQGRQVPAKDWTRLNEGFLRPDSAVEPTGADTTLRSDAAADKAPA